MFNNYDVNTNGELDYFNSIKNSCDVICNIVCNKNE